MAILSEDNRRKHSCREVCLQCSLKWEIWRERKLWGKWRLVQHIRCHYLCILLIFFPCLSLLLSHSVSLPHSFLCPPILSPSLPPFPPSSTCLSEMGWAICTPSTGGGPCLLSINNLWNSEIQVGPVSGWLYHTLEGGLSATFDGLSYLLLAFSVSFLQVWLQVRGPLQWLTTLLQITSAVHCAITFWGTLWLFPVATVSVWTASVAIGMRQTTQGSTFVLNARSRLLSGRCCGPTPLSAW